MQTLACAVRSTRSWSRTFWGDRRRSQVQLLLLRSTSASCALCAVSREIASSTCGALSKFNAQHQARSASCLHLARLFTNEWEFVCADAPLSGVTTAETALHVGLRGLVLSSVFCSASLLRARLFSCSFPRLFVNRRARTRALSKTPQTQPPSLRNRLSRRGCLRTLTSWLRLRAPIPRCAHARARAFVLCASRAFCAQVCSSVLGALLQLLANADANALQREPQEVRV